MVGTSSGAGAGEDLRPAGREMGLRQRRRRGSVEYLDHLNRSSSITRVSPNYRYQLLSYRQACATERLRTNHIDHTQTSHSHGSSRPDGHLRLDDDAVRQRDIRPARHVVAIIAIFRLGFTLDPLLPTYLLGLGAGCCHQPALALCQRSDAGLWRAVCQ